MQVRQIKHAVYFFIFCIICRFTYLILPRTIWLLKFFIVQNSLLTATVLNNPQGLILNSLQNGKFFYLLRLIFISISIIDKKYLLSDRPMCTRTDNEGIVKQLMTEFFFTRCHVLLSIKVKTQNVTMLFEKMKWFLYVFGCIKVNFGSLLQPLKVTSSIKLLQ